MATEEEFAADIGDCCQSSLQWHDGHHSLQHLCSAQLMCAVVLSWLLGRKRGGLLMPSTRQPRLGPRRQPCLRSGASQLGRATLQGENGHCLLKKQPAPL